MMKNTKKAAANSSAQYSANMIGGRLSFAAAEAYKLLRTNLDFSLPDGNSCKVIGFTSAMRGEGKTTTSINTAYTIAQTGKRVLLVEADLRLPNIAKRLGLHSRPGLSNLLVGQCQGRDILQRTKLIDNLWVAVAGDVPPNPAELLGSEQMRVTIETLSKIFDVIIVDLPPVNIVSDALIVSKYLGGIAVVVRQDYCTRSAVAEVIRQLKFSNAKILGFIMTGSDIHKKAYKHYGKQGDDSYGSAYEAAAKG